MKKIIITLSIILTVIACEESSHVDNKMLSVALEEEAPIINGYSKASIWRIKIYLLSVK